MASGALVNSEIEAGLNLVRALDEARFGVRAALWLYLSDMEKWRMVIAYEGKKKDLEKKIFEAARISANWRNSNPERPILDLGRVRITPADDPLIEGLHRVMHVDGLGQVRFSNNLINGIYVEDALIHRLAA